MNYSCLDYNYLMKIEDIMNSKKKNYIYIDIYSYQPKYLFCAILYELDWVRLSYFMPFYRKTFL